MENRNSGFRTVTGVMESKRGQTSSLGRGISIHQRIRQLIIDNPDGKFPGTDLCNASGGHDFLPKEPEQFSSGCGILNAIRKFILPHDNDGYHRSLIIPFCRDDDPLNGFTLLVSHAAYQPPSWFDPFYGFTVIWKAQVGSSGFEDNPLGGV